RTPPSVCRGVRASRTGRWCWARFLSHWSEQNFKMFRTAKTRASWFRLYVISGFRSIRTRRSRAHIFGGAPIPVEFRLNRRNYYLGTQERACDSLPRSSPLAVAFMNLTALQECEIGRLAIFWTLLNNLTCVRTACTETAIRRFALSLHTRCFFQRTSDNQQ